ncbi:MAG: hypothetical protein PVH03_13735, partial [Chloroflexota bacterium]
MKRFQQIQAAWSRKQPSWLYRWRNPLAALAILIALAFTAVGLVQARQEGQEDGSGTYVIAGH